VTCRYEGDAGKFRVTIDTAPQAWFRWTRGQVERIQTASEWANIPARQARRQGLLTVRVERPHSDRLARRAAIKVARAGLGPVDIPKRTGP
jgi:hypothetical protein